MNKSTSVNIDVRTGHVTYNEVDSPRISPPAPLPVGIDLLKLKAVLKERGIIADFSEVEPDA